MYNNSTLCEMSQRPIELVVVVSHEQGNNGDVPSPLKVSEASYCGYHRTPVMYLNHNQRHWCLVQQGYGSRSEHVQAVVSSSMTHPDLKV